MTRAPFQVLVYPYRQTGQNQWEFAIFKRADEGFWQAIAGGGEGNETPLQAARREAFEEAGILPTAEFMCLDTIESIPVTGFAESPAWGEQIYVIPQHCFGVHLISPELTLSEEHSEYAWLGYEQARQCIRFDGNKTALWELHQRLKGQGPRG